MGYNHAYLYVYRASMSEVLLVAIIIYMHYKFGHPIQNATHTYTSL